MTEEELKPKHERKYVCKHDVYKALLSIATSFIGALLALLVFAGLHRAPVPNGKFPPPMRQHIMDGGHRGIHHMKAPRGEARGEFRKGERPDKKVMKPQVPLDAVKQPEKK